MKNWNVPELQELSINATAGGPYHEHKFDGESIYDPDYVNPKTGAKGRTLWPAGDDNAYDN